ncbi:MAG: hypothetical protein JXQ80_07295 [Bacteroidales bacterium]|nr:hypothetical protein [Bacteroidales bacterium]
MKKPIQNILLVLMWFAICTNAMPQETVKMVTRKAEKTFPFNSKNGQVIINAEKGKIRIQSWDRDEVYVAFSISAKHEEADIARQELDYMSYNLVKDRSNVFLNNKMNPPATHKEISSVISAQYVIKVPVNADIRINNKFGSVIVTATNANLITGNLQYCDVLFQSYQGAINLTIEVGDLSCMNANLEGEVNSWHTNIMLTEITGKLALQTRYGSIHQKYGNKATDLTINSYATDILIDNRACHMLDIHLSGVNCPFAITETCFVPNKSLLQSTYNPAHIDAPWTFKYTPPVKSPRLKIQASFGTLNLL